MRIELIDTAFGLVAVFLLLLLWRNTRVHRFRMDLIRSDWRAFNRLPSYDTMLLRFWVWPLRRFLKERP